MPAPASDGWLAESGAMPTAAVPRNRLLNTYASDPEHRAARNVSWRARYADPEKRAARNDQRRARYRDRYASDPVYRARCLASVASRNAAKLDRICEHGPSCWSDAARNLTRRCEACGTRRGPFHHDHIQPLASGGLHCARNLQILCGPCNTRKQARDFTTIQPYAQGRLA